MIRPSRRLTLGAAATLLLAAAGLLIPWDSPPLPAALEELGRELERAEELGARRWAPEPLAEALAARDRVRAAISAASRRPPLLRDYEPARQRLAEARERARAAGTAASAARQEAATASGALLAAAAQRLEAARQTADRVKLRGSGRQALRQAEIALDDARRKHDREAYEEAALEAGRAMALSQEWGERAQAVLDRLDSVEALSAWNRWIEETIAWSRRSGEAAIVVDKAERTLLLYQGGRLARSFSVELGRNPVADKLREGDDATPEGKYRITEVRGPGQTRFYRAFMLDYPNAEDWTRFRQARKEGRLSSRSRIGGLIEIHGHGGKGADWTNGCVALTDPEMDYLTPRVRVGTPVTIVGARRPGAQRRGERSVGGGR